MTGGPDAWRARPTPSTPSRALQHEDAAPRSDRLRPQRQVPESGGHHQVQRPATSSRPSHPRPARNTQPAGPERLVPPAVDRVVVVPVRRRRTQRAERPRAAARRSPNSTATTATMQAVLPGPAPPLLAAGHPNRPRPGGSRHAGAASTTSPRPVPRAVGHPGIARAARPPPRGHQGGHQRPGPSADRSPRPGAAAEAAERPPDCTDVRRAGRLSPPGPETASSGRRRTGRERPQHPTRSWRRPRR